jgi:nicotinamidase-related amidase
VPGLCAAAGGVEAGDNCKFDKWFGGKRFVARKGLKMNYDSYSAFLDDGRLETAQNKTNCQAGGNWTKCVPSTGLAERFVKLGLHSPMTEKKEKKVENPKVFYIGIAGDYCVRWTADDGQMLGFESFAIKDLTRSVQDTTTGHMTKATEQLYERAKIIEKKDVKAENKKNDILIVVDVQNDFVQPVDNTKGFQGVGPKGTGSLAVADADQAYVKEVIDFVKSWKGPVVLSQDYHPKGHMSFASTQGRDVLTPQTLPRCKAGVAECQNKPEKQMKKTDL